MLYAGPNRVRVTEPSEGIPQPPSTPDSCDSTMVLDAVTTLRGDMIFFKDRYLLITESTQMFKCRNMNKVVFFFYS